MEILFYQGLIFTTLVLVRVFSAKHLEIACFIWTALTLINLFWPPLIILQLFVIWGTYGLIKPKRPQELLPETGRPPKPAAPFGTKTITTVVHPRRLQSASPSPPKEHLKTDMLSAASHEAELERPKAPLEAAWQHEAVKANKFRAKTLDKAAEGHLATVHNGVRAQVDAKKLDELHSDEIRAYVKEIGIPHLIHFTRCENLRSIFRHGLHSIKSCDEEGIHSVRNDQIRLDGQPDGISLSVTFPNFRMFYKYRQMDVTSDWAVLLLSPKILWEKRCGFFRHNAADSRMRALPRAEVTTLQALREMFEAPGVEREHWLRPYDPTDPQAEVMVYEAIEPSLIETVAFETKQVADKWRSTLEGRDTIYAGPEKGLFASRIQIRMN